MLFNRTASLKIIESTGQETDLSGLRVAFTVTKSISPTQNKAVIDIYNVSETTRSRILTRDNSIVLSAGYVGDHGEEVVFRGSMLSFPVNKIPPIIQVRITAGDGSKALRETKISQSFEAGTSVKQVVTELAKDMGVAVRELGSQIQEQFSGGFSASGPVTPILDQVADKMGADWSIQDEELQILSQNETTGERVTVLDPASGLIGSPQSIPPDATQLASKAKTQSRFKVKSLLRPKLRPGDKVQVESQDVSGLFKILSVKHKGDTHGKDWTSNMEISQL